MTDPPPSVGIRTPAEIVSALTTPYLTVPLFILFAGLRFVDDLTEVIVYGVVAVGFTVVIPLLYTERLRRRGEVDSVHIFEQRARLGPLALVGVCTAVGFGLLYYIRARPEILRLMVLLFALAASMLVATVFLKVSGHVSSWTSGATILTVLYGWYLSPILLVAVPIGWARLKLERHRPREVALGFVYGIAVCLAFAWALGFA